jgi:hypothetical protein
MFFAHDVAETSGDGSQVRHSRDLRSQIVVKENHWLCSLGRIQLLCHLSNWSTNVTRFVAAAMLFIALLLPRKYHLIFQHCTEQMYCCAGLSY